MSEDPPLSEDSFKLNGIAILSTQKMEITKCIIEKVGYHVAHQISAQYNNTKDKTGSDDTPICRYGTTISKEM